MEVKQHKDEAEKAGKYKDVKQIIEEAKRITEEAKQITKKAKQVVEQLAGGRIILLQTCGELMEEGKSFDGW